MKCKHTTETKIKGFTLFCFTQVMINIFELAVLKFVRIEYPLVESYVDEQTTI